MNLRNEIKTRLEIIPILLVFESTVCFIFSYFKFYAFVFDAWEELNCCSLLTCAILYAHSENWKLFSKKCLLTCVLLNILNFVNLIVKIDNYYFYFQSIIYGLAFFIIIFEIWKKN